MVVVMPAGHTTFPATQASRQQFIDEFLADIMPYVEKNFRVRNDRSAGRLPVSRWAVGRP